jgi:preprotein translocase subunit SecD
MRRAAYWVVLMALMCFCGQRDRPVLLAFHLAETQPSEGLKRMAVQGVGETFFLHPRAEITNADVAAATVGESHGHPVVELLLTRTGREKLARLTQENVGKRVGMLVDGKLVAAPVIRAPIIQGRAIIDGNFSETEARRVAENIVGR